MLKGRFFIENQSFSDNSFDRYPIGEKIDLADSEKRTPEAKFRLFISAFQKITVFQKKSTFVDPPLGLPWSWMGP